MICLLASEGDYTCKPTAFCKVRTLADQTIVGPRRAMSVDGRSNGSIRLVALTRPHHDLELTIVISKIWVTKEPNNSHYRSLFFL